MVPHTQLSTAAAGIKLKNVCDALAVVLVLNTVQGLYIVLAVVILVSGPSIAKQISCLFLCAAVVTVGYYIHSHQCTVLYVKMYNFCSK